MVFPVFQKLLQGLVSIIYPARCPLCGVFNEDSKPCDSCASGLVVLDAPSTPSPGVVSRLSACCSCFAFEGRVKDAIHGLKYSGDLSIVRYFAAVLVERMRAFPDFDAVVPVPMTRAKIVKRGFNQSALLASALAKKTGRPFCAKALLRTGSGKPQVELGHAERIDAVRGAFGVSEKGREAVRDKRILVVDDVMTTGATLAECAKVLLGAGAKEVFAVTVARTL